MSLIKSLIPGLLKNLGGADNSVIELLEKEQQKHSDKFVYIITTNAENKPIVTGATISSEGKITQTEISVQAETKKHIKISDLLEIILKSI